jgi:hypothetical protein
LTYIIKNDKTSNFVHNVDTSFASEGSPWTPASNTHVIGTSIKYYYGTEVTYTPTLGSSNVVYECNLQIAWNPDNAGSSMNTRLQYSTDDGSNWVDIDGAKLYEGTENNGGDYDWLNFMWVFIIDTWSGERKLRLAGRASTSSTEYALGRSYDATGAEGVGVCPHVTIYSVE